MIKESRKQNSNTPIMARFNLAIIGVPLSIIVFAICYLPFALPVHASVIISKPMNNLNLVGWWRLDEGSGTVAHDFSGRKNNGSMSNFSNPPTSVSGWANGRFGKALNFDGGDDQINAGSDNSLNITSDGTIALWVNPRSYGGSGSSNILVRDNGASGYLITIDNVSITNGYSVFMGSGSSVDLPDSVVFNTWQHLVITKTSTTLRLYLNGVLANTGTSPSIGAANRPFYIGSDGTTGFFDGLVDDVRVYTRALSAGEVGNLYKVGSVTIGKPSNDTVTNGMVAHWSFDGKDIDWSLNTGYKAFDSIGGNTGAIANMSPTKSTTFGKNGQALAFNLDDGTVTGDDYIVASGFTAPSTGTFTAWVKTDFDEATCCSSFPSLFDTTAPRLNLAYNGTTDSFTLTTNGVSTNRATYNPGADIVGWWHLAVTWSATGSQIYRNGVAVGVTGTGDNSGTPGSTFYIGNRASAQDRGWLGNIDDVRVYNRVLSATEIKSLANSGFITAGKSDATSMSDGLVGYWPFDGKSTNWGTNQTLDMSGNGNDGTMISMSTSTSPALGKIGQALIFDNTNDYISVTNTTSFDFDRMSICAWINPKSIDNYDTFVSKESGSTGWEFFIADTTNPNSLQFVTGTGSGSGGGWWVSPTNSIVVNQWQHVCVAYDNSSFSNIPVMYVNGVSQSVAVRNAQTGLPDITNTNPLVIGAYDASSYFFPGSIDDVRIYNRVLSASDVQKLYKLGSK